MSNTIKWKIIFFIFKLYLFYVDDLWKLTSDYWTKPQEKLTQRLELLRRANVLRYLVQTKHKAQSHFLRLGSTVVNRSPFVLGVAGSNLVWTKTTDSVIIGLWDLSGWPFMRNSRPHNIATILHHAILEKLITPAMHFIFTIFKSWRLHKQKINITVFLY